MNYSELFLQSMLQLSRMRVKKKKGQYTIVRELCYQDWKNMKSIVTFVGEYCSWRRTILLNQFQRRGVKI